MHFIRIVTFSLTVFFLESVSAAEVPIYDFSLNEYPQSLNTILAPDQADYTTPLLSKKYQSAQFHEFYRHAYASDAQGLSPWSQAFVQNIIPLVYPFELKALNYFDNNNSKAANTLHYRENYKLQENHWIKSIENNMNLAAIAALEYQDNHRAITIRNTHGRILPEAAPDFFHFSIAGQGFPFDNLQESAIWVGTPLYVFSESKDKTWSFVLTSDGYFAWIKSNDLAFVNPEFMQQWQAAAKACLMAIVKTQTHIFNDQRQFLENAYIGTVFPKGSGKNAVLFPIKNRSNQAMITKAYVSDNAAVLMPLTASKKNLASILQQLQNRPYGWGGLFFYNDCSQELKSLFTPFGLWLPRNSSQQSKIATSLDLSEEPLEKRLEILKNKGKPLLTLIYINHHIMLYMGQLENNTALVYQNAWGLAPRSRDKRYIIGGSVFLPLLNVFPQNPEIQSQADGSIFKLIFMDKMPSEGKSSKQFVQDIILNKILGDK